MEIPKINFKSLNKKVRNDIVYEKPFEIINRAYVFTIFPKSNFWRFGLRFLKNPDDKIDISNENRHYNSEFKDLHLSIGNLESGEWINSNRLELIQYHFTNPSGVISRCDNYITLSPVQFRINYDNETKTLNVSYDSKGCSKYEAKLDLNNYRFFKIFSWADEIDFEIDCVVEQMYTDYPVYDNDESTSVSLIDAQFYLADSFWGNNDQTKRFTENGIWEIDPEKKEASSITIANINDIIFLKKNNQESEKNNLHIIALGIITHNPFTGNTLEVDWRIKNLSLDIKASNLLTKSFTIISADIAKIILNAIGNDTLTKFELQNLIFDRKYTDGDFNEDFSTDDFNSESGYLPKIARLVNDSDKSTDHLGVDKDVLAFAKIMASKNFKPPLAIALFGKWGSGKSFFMNLLNEKILNLSESSNNNAYCKEIVQIHFNAWSYLDANLWASIVTQIFSGLSNYIRNSNESDDIKKKIEIELTKNLTLSKEQHILLLKEKEEDELKLKTLNSEKENLHKDLEEKINKIKNAKFSEFVDKIDTEFNVKNKITAALEQNESLEMTRKELEGIVPEEYWKNPIILFEEIRSKTTFIRELFNKKRILWNLLWITLILIIIAVVPPFLKQIIPWLQTANFLIPQVIISCVTVLATIGKRIRNTYRKLQPIISTFWNIKEAYEKEIQNALYDFKQNEKVLILEIDEKKKRIDAIESNIKSVKENINSLDFRLNNTLASEALYSFIDSRSKSDDYKKHLGLVSYIRKDFEVLSQLFDEHNNETQNFREKLAKNIDRIILYIDDLDRCPEERVIEVLEAVNLLMAFPLFIVVVGVDPRWVKNSLTNKYNLQFGNSNQSIEKIEASNYLEKIFQVPFHLKEASDTNVKAMLRNLTTYDNPNKPTIQNNDERSISESTYLIDKIEEINTDELTVMAGTTVTTNVKTHNATTESEHLILSEKEVELIQGFSKIIGNNPRSIKRFVNIYQIIRAHEGLSIQAKNEDREYITIMFLLALHIGPFQKILNKINNFFHHSESDVDFGTHLKKIFEEPIDDNKFNEEASMYRLLNDIMTNFDSGKTLLKFTSTDFNTKLNFIKRFTFADAV